MTHVDGDQYLAKTRSADRVVAPNFRLLWHPIAEPDRRDITGEWGLEAWRGGGRQWAVGLSKLGAYSWVKPGLAQTVAARVLRGQRVTVQGWLPCGGTQVPLFWPISAPPIPQRRPVITRTQGVVGRNADRTTRPVTS